VFPSADTVPLSGGSESTGDGGEVVHLEGLDDVGHVVGLAVVVRALVGGEEVVEVAPVGEGDFDHDGVALFIRKPITDDLIEAVIDSYLAARSDRDSP